MAFELLARLGLNATGFESGLKKQRENARKTAEQIADDYKKSADKIKKEYYKMWAAGQVMTQNLASQPTADAMIAAGLQAARDRQSAARQSFGAESWGNKAQTNAVKDAMSDAARSTAMMKGDFWSIGKAVAGLGIVRMFMSAAENAKQTLRAAQDLQVTLNTLNAFQQSDSSGIAGLEKIFNKIQEAANDGIEPFAKLGVKIRDANGALKPTEEIVKALATAMQGGATYADKFGTAVEVAGVKGASKLVETLKKVNSETSTFEEMSNAGTRVLSFFGEAIEEIPKNAAKVGKSLLGMLDFLSINEMTKLGEEAAASKAKTAEATAAKIRALQEEEDLILSAYQTELDFNERVLEIRKEIARVDREKMMRNMTDEEKLVQLNRELFEILERQQETEEDAAQNQLDAKKKEAEIEALMKGINKDAGGIGGASRSSVSVNQLQRIGAQVDGTTPRTETLLRQQLEQQKRIAQNTSRQGEVIPA